MSDRVENLRRANRRLALRLGFLALLAVGFGFALVPIYDVLCRVAGINGKTVQAAAEVADNTQVDDSRSITVQFMGTPMSNSPLEFEPVQTRMEVHPGQLAHASYRVRNPTDRVFVGQAIPSVTPGEAARHFQKIVCFCFERQEFQPGEVRELPVTFVISPDLSDKVVAVTLSYAFFQAPDDSTKG
ncbi:MAG: cytochrome c oxidase assembly protein [Chromatiales bacterium]|jgi:cytochrome c oxidase assembly protein subunit 11|nr:cytochrome c oxidase assembly protein [Chromatiales bacterium]MDX9767264.1 cytochrome c oxidase assembly protein [Ectothiorhodospiraceae bacterium]